MPVQSYYIKKNRIRSRRTPFQKMTACQKRLKIGKENLSINHKNAWRNEAKWRNRISDDNYIQENVLGKKKEVLKIHTSSTYMCCITKNYDPG